MSSGFMMSGYDKWEFKIKKRLYSYVRLKNLLTNSGFKKEQVCGATYVFPKDNMFHGMFTIWGAFVQKLSDYKIVPYLFAMADNIIIHMKKPS
jgi:hypothetical protein